MLCHTLRRTLRRQSLASVPTLSWARDHTLNFIGVITPCHHALAAATHPFPHLQNAQDT